MELAPHEWLLIAAMIAVVGRIAWVDAHTMRIPDHWNAAVAGLGIFYQLSTTGMDRLLAAAASACITMLVLLAIRSAYMLLRGKNGLGLGDVKLAGASVLWLGFWDVPLFFLIASLLALMFAICALCVGHHDARSQRIPFGPFLGLSLVLIWVARTTQIFPIGV